MGLINVNVENEGDLDIVIDNVCGVRVCAISLVNLVRFDYFGRLFGRGVIWIDRFEWNEGVSFMRVFELKWNYTLLLLWADLVNVVMCTVFRCLVVDDGIERSMR